MRDYFKTCTYLYNIGTTVFTTSFSLLKISVPFDIGRKRLFLGYRMLVCLLYYINFCCQTINIILQKSDQIISFLQCFDVYSNTFHSPTTSWFIQKVFAFWLRRRSTYGRVWVIINEILIVIRIILRLFCQDAFLICNNIDNKNMLMKFIVNVFGNLHILLKQSY